MQFAVIASINKREQEYGAESIEGVPRAVGKKQLLPEFAAGVTVDRLHVFM